MKLQERYTDSPPPEGDANDPEYYARYTSEKDSRDNGSSGTGRTDPDSDNSENSDDGFERTKEFHSSVNSDRLTPTEPTVSSQKEENPHDQKKEPHAEDVDNTEEKVNGDRLQPPGNEEFTCPHCDIMFKNCVMYNLHMGYHGFQDPFKCNMCGHTSSTSVEFYLHIAQAAH